jgi:hypothetical protein
MGGISWMPELEQFEECEPTEQEMRAAAIHHTLTGVVAELEKTPAEWVDFATMATAVNAIILKMREKLDVAD